MLKLYIRCQTLKNDVLQAIKKDSGQDLLEYALLVALIALVAVGAITLAGKNVNTIFGNVAAQLGGAT
jgi:pilus assembly protein Flp/PilA